MFKFLSKFFKKEPTFPPPTHPVPNAAFYKSLYPGMSSCSRCGLPWAMVEKHVVTITKTEEGSTGRYPCCESCWSNMSLSYRMSHMGRLCDHDDAWDKYLGYKIDPQSRTDHLAAVFTEWATEKAAAKKKIIGMLSQDSKVQIGYSDLMDLSYVKKPNHIAKTPQVEEEPPVYSEEIY